MLGRALKNEFSQGSSVLFVPGCQLFVLAFESQCCYGWRNPRSKSHLQTLLDNGGSSSSGGGASSSNGGIHFHLSKRESSVFHSEL